MSGEYSEYDDFPAPSEQTQGASNSQPIPRKEVDAAEVGFFHHEGRRYVEIRRASCQYCGEETDHEARNGNLICRQCGGARRDDD